MRFIADFHLHSRFSRATSDEITVENLAKWAQVKGIDILGTGDFTHPAWLKELQEKLEPAAESGLFRLKARSEKPRVKGNGLKADGRSTRFILTTEISCIYGKKDRLRKIHLLVLSPSFEAVEKINARLGLIGNLKADGRPILGLDAKELLKIVLQSSPASLVIPAHAWTPWFSLFGSKSGFDSVEECFEDYAPHIFALETGLSADPQMFWRLSALDKYTLVSNSDAHSLAKLGREANVFEGPEISYRLIAAAIKRREEGLRLNETLEFFPEEGKYHFDGHRLCQVVLSPAESRQNKNLCPVCRRPLTIGVLNRVEELADRPEGIRPERARPFRHLIPLVEIIAEALNVLPGAKQVQQEYQNLVLKLGSEFQILLEKSPGELRSVTLPEIAEGILRVREGKVRLEPGFDGVFGRIRLFEPGEQERISQQKTLF